MQIWERKTGAVLNMLNLGTCTVSSLKWSPQRGQCLTNIWQSWVKQIEAETTEKEVIYRVTSRWEEGQGQSCGGYLHFRGRTEKRQQRRFRKNSKKNGWKKEGKQKWITMTEKTSTIWISQVSLCCKHLPTSTRWMQIITLWDGYYNYPHFLSEEMERQKA